VEDLKDKKERKVELNKEITEALNEIADTKAGVVVLKWLKHRCFYERSTIVGNPITYEINQLGSISHEILRRLYLDIRRYIKPYLRKRIEQ